jgi:hypothetical protein
MKEEVIGDSSVIKLQKAGEEDEIVEAYVTHSRSHRQEQSATVSGLAGA